MRNRDMPDNLIKEAAPALTLQGPEESQGSAAGNYYILRSDMAKFCATPGCKVSTFVSRGFKSSVKHSDEYRQKHGST